MKIKNLSYVLSLTVLLQSSLPLAFAKTPVYEQMNQIRKQDQSSVILRGDVEGIYVRVKADKTVAYPGEAVTLQYDLMTRFDARFERFEKETDLSAFGVYTFPAEKFQTEVKRSIFFVDQHYTLTTFRKQVIFTSKTETSAIKPGEIRISYRVSPVLRKLTVVKTDRTIPLVVTPYPEKGKPVDFSGLTGQFQAKTYLDTSELENAGTVQFRFSAWGNGDLHRAVLPIFEFPEKLTALSTQEDMSADMTDRGRLVIKKEVTVLLKPEETGLFTIPGISISYFDPSSRRYKNKVTPDLALNVSVIPAENPVPAEESLPVSVMDERNQREQFIESSREDRPKPSDNFLILTGEIFKAPKPLKELHENLPNLFLMAQEKMNAPRSDLQVPEEQTLQSASEAVSGSPVLTR